MTVDCEKNKPTSERVKAAVREVLNDFSPAEVQYILGQLKKRLKEIEDNEL